MTNCSLSLDSTLRTFTPATHVRTLRDSKFWGEYRGVSKLRSPTRTCFWPTTCPVWTPCMAVRVWQPWLQGVRVDSSTFGDKQLSSANPLISPRSAFPAVLKPTMYSPHRIVNDKQFSSVILLSLHALPSQRSLSQHCTRTSADKPISISLRPTKSPSANIGHASPSP